MNALPNPAHDSGALSFKDFWLQCYVAALVNRTPEEAIAIAEKSVEACDEYWRTKREVIPSLQRRHDYPLGFPFS